MQAKLLSWYLGRLSVGLSNISLFALASGNCDRPIGINQEISSIPLLEKKKYQ